MSLISFMLCDDTYSVVTSCGHILWPQHAWLLKCLSLYLCVYHRGIGINKGISFYDIPFNIFNGSSLSKAKCQEDIIIAL